MTARVLFTTALLWFAACACAEKQVDAGIFARDFVEPTAIAVTAIGEIVVADAGRGEVAVLDSSGRVVRRFGRGILVSPEGVSADPDGSILVSDSTENRVHRFTADGSLLGSFGRSGTGLGEFSGAGPLDVAADGRIHVLDIDHGRVQVFDRGGAFLFAFGKQGDYLVVRSPDELYYPGGLAVGRDGRVYVADTHHFRMATFSADGRFLNAWGGPGGGAGQFDHVFGVAVDGARDRVYVADDHVPEHPDVPGDGSRLQIFTRSGRFVASIALRVEGQPVKHPFDVALGPDGRLYVTERGAGRVLVVPTDDR